MLPDKYESKRINKCDRCGKLFTNNQLRKHVERGFCFKKEVVEDVTIEQQATEEMKR